MNDKKKIFDDAIERMKQLSLGDKVTNICAGDCNPHRLSYFVELKVRHTKSLYDIIHTERTARCTDKRGEFWETGIEVVYPGWLDRDKCEELFQPIWEANYK